LLFFTAAFALSDLYYLGGRYFDYFVVLISLVLVYLFRYKNKTLMLDLIRLTLILSPWLLMSFLTGNSLLAFAIIVGLIIVIPGTFDLVSSDIPLLKRTFENVMFAIVFLLIFQFAIFQLTGNYIDFTSKLGSYSGRGYRGYGLFRPHGIMQEPNAYSTVLFALLYLYSKFPYVRHWLVNLAFISILLSLSLWGVLMVPIFYSIFYRRLLSKRALIISVITIAFSASAIFDAIEGTNIIERLDFSAEDSSRNARYGNIDDMVNSIGFITGNGFNSNIFQKFGANGISFILHSLGVIGCLILMIVVRLQNVLHAKDIIFIGLMYTTFPIASYMYFYVTIGSIIAINRGLCAEY
jgi:hypothetical protein